MKFVNHFRSVVISDVIFNGRPARPRQILKFLKTSRWDRLILQYSYFPLVCSNETTKRFLNKLSAIAIKYEANITIISRAHPSQSNNEFFNIKFAEEYFLEAPQGKYMLIESTSKIKNTGRKYWNLSRFANYALFKINMLYNSWRSKKQQDSHSLFQLPALPPYLEPSVKKTLLSISKDQNCKGIITGSRFAPFMYWFQDMEYLNTGYWSSSATALIEDDKSKWSLLRYPQAKEEFKEARLHDKIQKQFINTQEMNASQEPNRYAG